MQDVAEAPRLMCEKAVVEKTSLSRSTISRLVESAEFPKPLKLSANRIAWREPDINEWINGRSVAA